MKNYLDQFPPVTMCACGHVAADHSLRGCAYQHDYGLGPDGNWHFTPCNRFEPKEA